MSSLGKRLKIQREKRGWSQLLVAEKLDIANTVLSNYERDYRDPDTETLSRLADLYEVSVDYLLGRTNNPSLVAKDLPIEIDLSPESVEELRKFAELLKIKDMSDRNKNNNERQYVSRNEN